MIRRYKLGSDVELHKRTLEMGELSLIGAEARRVAGAGALGPRRARQRCAARSPGSRSCSSPPTSASTSSATPRRPRPCARRCSRAGASEVSEEAAEIVRVEPAARATALDLDESVIPQEAGLNERAVSFTKGCYVGQETVARLLLPRQAQPPPARAAAQRRRSSRARRCGSARRRSGASRSAGRLPRPRADRARARAPRGRARRHARGRRRRASPPRSSSCLSERSLLTLIARSCTGSTVGVDPFRRSRRWPRTSSSSPTSPPARPT